MHSSICPYTRMWLIVRYVKDWLDSCNDIKDFSKREKNPTEVKFFYNLHTSVIAVARGQRKIIKKALMYSAIYV